MEKLHLDSEYRNRWVEFHLADGTIEDSRLKNWRHVQWGQVIRLVAHLRNHSHTIECTDPRFITFMNFRWGGSEPLFDGDKCVGRRPIRIWTIGWTDGDTCFLKDISFFTGQLIKDYTSPLSQFANHIHPNVRNAMRGIV